LRPTNQNSAITNSLQRNALSMTGPDIKSKEFLLRLMPFLFLPVIVLACTEEFSEARQTEIIV